MRHLCIAIAVPAVLLAAGVAFGQAGAAGVAPRSPGYEPLSYPHAAPHRYRPHHANGPQQRYALAPYAYGLPPRYGPPPQYGPPPSYAPPGSAFTASTGYGPRPEYGPAALGHAPLPSAYGSLPYYGSKPEYGLPPHTYDPMPHAMPHDSSARFKVWNEIANSFTEALLQVRLASPRDYSRFPPQLAHAAHPR